jgi:hypothetical protein
MDGRIILAGSIIFGVLVGAWMFRYEGYGTANAVHRDRFTGAVCFAQDECWSSSDKRLVD